jgi:AcrR family transcriptional regulator
MRRGIPVLRRPRSPGRREQIIEAGRRVIFAEGIWNATTRRIAEVAGINLATIHYHFANKDALLVAIYDDMLATIRAESRRDFAAPSPLAERIERAIALSWDFSQRNMEGQLMQSELTNYAIRNGLDELAARQSQEYLGIYSRVFHEATDVQGRTDLDIDGLSRFIIAGTDGILLQHFAEPDSRRTGEDFRKLAICAQGYPLTSASPTVTARDLKAGRRRRS